jgi:hypothetical protein
VSFDNAPVHQVLFRLAARAPGLTLEELMKRLTTGLANHYAAVTCSIHADAQGRPAAAAEPIRALRKLETADRAMFDATEARLVRAAVEKRVMVSALDLDDSAEFESFLSRTLGAMDLFAFPLLVGGTVRAVLVLGLSLDSDPLEAADLHGLMAAGELLALAAG